MNLFHLSSVSNKKKYESIQYSIVLAEPNSDACWTLRFMGPPPHFINVYHREAQGRGYKVYN